MKMRNKKVYNFPVIIEKDETGYYFARVPALKSCYTQAKTLPELYKRVREVILLCLEVEEQLFGKIPERNEFVGIQNLEIVR
ncbi:MAG: type II toxin-antitoxin system HicB family antitoxin [Patescibacteria group bacterium]